MKKYYAVKAKVKEYLTGEEKGRCSVSDIRNWLIRDGLEVTLLETSHVVGEVNRELNNWEERIGE